MFRRWFALTQEEWDSLLQEVSSLKELEEQITQRVSLEEVSVEKNKKLLALIVRAQEELKKSSSNVSARLEHELEEEHFWVEWKELLELQSHLCKEWITEKEQAQLNALVKKEKKLLELFTHIVTHKAFAELHAHTSASMSDEGVWEWFCERGVEIDWVGLKQEQEGFGNKFSDDDAKTLNILSREVREKNLPRKELYRRFLKIIRQKFNGDAQTFRQFMEKADIINALHQQIIFGEENDDVRIQEYKRTFLDKIRSHAREGITYLESRGADSKDFRLNLEGMRRAQQEDSSCIIKQIPMFVYQTENEERINDVKRMVDNVYSLMDEYKDFVAGFDVIESSPINKPHEFTIIKYICEKNKTGRHKLNITTHIGEYFSKHNWGHHDDIACFRVQLDNVERVLSFYEGGLRRLGHANVLGVDIEQMFSQYSLEELQPLIDQQERTIKKIIELSICVETNPTSNYFVAGINYKDSTAAQLIKKAYDIKKKHDLNKPIFVTINTDDRVIFGGRLLQEFLRVAYHAGLNKEAVDELRANAHKCYLDKM